MKNGNLLCMDFPSSYVAIDLEFTDDYKHDIIEIGAIKVVNSKVVDTFNTLVMPEKAKKVKKSDIKRGKVKSFIEKNGVKYYYISSFVETLTGISNCELEKAPMESEVILKLDEFIGDMPIIGHGMGTDIRLLERSYQNTLNKHFENSYMDTFLMSNFLYSMNASLSNLCSHLGIEVKEAHRAYLDAELTRKCYEVMRETFLSNYMDVDDFNERFISFLILDSFNPYVMPKNKFCKKINNKVWSSDKDALKNGEIWGIIDSSYVTISSSVPESLKKKIKMELSFVDSFVDELSVNTDYFIVNSMDEYNSDPEFKKVIYMVKHFSQIKILTADEVLGAFDASRENGELFKIDIDGYDEYSSYNNEGSLVYSSEEGYTEKNIDSECNEYTIEGKKIFLHGEFLSVNVEIIKSRLIEKGAIISSESMEDIDYLIVGGRENYDEFIETNVFKDHLLKISYGYNTKLLNERMFIDLFDVIKK